MHFINTNVLSASDTASHNGIQIDSNSYINVSFIASFGDSSAAGTLQLQASNDINHEFYQPSNFTVTNWVNIPGASATVTGGSSALISLSNIAYRWLRVTYTYTSGGSSTINVNMMANYV